MSSEDDAALSAWIAALNHELPAEIAVSPDIVVERYGWAPGRLVVAERISGAREVSVWIHRNRGHARFELDPAPPFSALPPFRVVRYRMHWGDYINGGIWAYTLIDGRIATLTHRPEDVPLEWRHGPPSGKKLPQGP